MEDLKREIESLAGETLALQSILYWMVFHVTRGHPTPIAQAIDDAANLVENEAIRYGSAVSPNHLVKALKIVEHFRDALPPEPPKSAV